jgi:RNA polymerase sigma factor (sigma-70 family)
MRGWERDGQILARARAGDGDAFRELTDPYRRELLLHAYRIVGSTQDAEDLLQETLLAAWRGLEQFQGRASVRAWLYRIATNRSLDALRASRRRPEGEERMTDVPEPTRRTDPIWLEPHAAVNMGDTQRVHLVVDCYATAATVELLRNAAPAPLPAPRSHANDSLRDNR